MRQLIKSGAMIANTYGYAHFSSALRFIGFFIAVISPFAHRSSHDKNLVFKFRTGFARQEVQLQGKLV